MALPTLTVILADNQEPIATRLAEMGVTKNLGWHTALTTEKIGAVLSSLLDNQTVRQEMSHRGRNLVDGLGSQRVAAHLSGSYVQLRPATEADSLRLFEWVNEPTVRQASFHSAPIPWTQHLTWLQRKLDDTNCQIYIGENIQGQAVGQVRFEAEGAEAVISVSLAPVYRGKGYGVEFIAAATLTYTRQTTVTTIHAYIKQDNNASRRAFLMAGYVEMAPTDIHHTPAWHLTWRCPDAPFHL
jgi:RimJ/RimL family protein N-acetyltransferase